MAAATNLTRAQLAMRGRIAAHARWAQEDPARNAQRGQAGLMAKFLAEVDAVAAAKGETLTEPERQRRAESLRKAHMARLALASSKARKAAAG